MSIYSVAKLKEKVNTKTNEELRAILTRLLEKRLSQTTFNTVSRLIMGYDLNSEAKPYCILREDKVIPYAAMRNLKESGMVEFAPEIIRVASREPMIIHDILHGVRACRKGMIERPFFIQEDGTISKTHKVFVGYILTMAGFKSMSVYDRLKQGSVKRWKIEFPYENTIEERIKFVQFQVDAELDFAEAKLKPDNGVEPEPSIPEGLI